MSSWKSFLPITLLWAGVFGMELEGLGWHRQAKGKVPISCAQYSQLGRQTPARTWVCWSLKSSCSRLCVGCGGKGLEEKFPMDCLL